MISAGGIPIRRTDQTWQRVPGNGPSGAYRLAKPICVADKPSIQSNPTTLVFEPAMMVDILRNAVLPSANRAFGPRFSSYAGAIAFLKQCGYSSLRSLPITFQKAFTPRMLKILRLRYPAFKKKFDRYYGFFTGRHAKSVRNSAQAKMMYGTIFRQTQVANVTGVKCPSGSASPAIPPATPAPPAVPVTRPVVRPADGQMALQSALVAAVRSVYGAATSSSAAKVVLKTQKWSTLRQLGITAHIMSAFGSLGYRRAARNSRVAQRLVKKTLRNWMRASGGTSQAQPRPVPRPIPAPAPTPRPIQASITPAQRKKLVLTALLVALKTKSLATTSAEAIAFAKGQSWSTVLALKLHIKFIEELNKDTRLGKSRPANNRSQTKAAQKLYLSLKK